ncbi:Tyrosine-protein kinase Shark,Receptor tyrosine-protein kinase erbB-4,Tyrosine-protein kinase ZAP-70,Melanoma receptor tyrosine-protein kinase,Ephrin type-A receptor 2,Tyrosine-protein kinase JAK1,Tyrosine-protein kinase Fer,Tyrosine-protein kinase FRK,Ack-related non-receptor tyrosine kinase,Tyrosine-protein kinase HTK16,Tyrosine-protein kinase SYK [Mytilus edulis]|uniref:Protein kinase domain-containing protein n=1 Tax=Mytilus edulis TaxID=6550 RepID=A0A8S3QPB7_MYTED|nr:Tyrosine-protein kinase Shark,Receptor tyrosine-protein kinase erbB-4,Tyrosine-protein kinase ZAP-70,Melanoma receptor tyrosine-protein kinase,Ephrin type-A receptor 2,Tyrosine-protein kinase JAK1,Tyrosine-protein kinase Fer,Tyrosine-protein kinase FRK,Ack-related non-receptor tyrosine kinase,Tyrosine-protein kinase HTK16,Tyrosine-protein kinase SYK [Mytilus edulis]
MNEIRIVTEIHLTGKVNTTVIGLGNTIYASNSSGEPEKELFLYRVSLPNNIITNSVFRYLTYIPSIKTASVELEICEIGIVVRSEIKGNLIAPAIGGSIGAVAVILIPFLAFIIYKRNSKSTKDKYFDKSNPSTKTTLKKEKLLMEKNMHFAVITPDADEVTIHMKDTQDTKQSSENDDIYRLLLLLKASTLGPTVIKIDLCPILLMESQHHNLLFHGIHQISKENPTPIPTGAERANWTGGNWEQPGSGQFGSVQKGYCTLKGKGRIPVAVKKLKSDDKSAEEEMLKEADVMKNLSHKRIVRMIGLCRADCIMLVLELCPCGPLNSFLAKHKEMKQSAVVNLMWQVAQGMAYLHSQNYVHRDLAARNVLLVSKSSAKISDFGMSKAYNIGNDYYKAREAGKWPLKWYAPECVYFWKFDAKSDVWSYGITLWEATSYGEKPYKTLKGNEIMKFLVEDKMRLKKPEFCDEQVYENYVRVLAI